MESCIKRWNQIQKQKKDVQNQNTDNTERMVSFQKDIERMEKDIVRVMESRKKNEEKNEDYNKEKQNLLKYEEAYNQEIKNFDEVISEKEAELLPLFSSIEDHKNYGIKK